MDSYKRSSSPATTARNLAEAAPPYTPLELLQLGAVWYLSADEYHHNCDAEEQQRQQDLEEDNESTATRTTTTSYHRHQSSIALYKPNRLSMNNFTATSPSLLELQAGDYLRIHHTPRRFQQVHQKNWTKPTSNTTAATMNSTTTSDHAIVAVGDGYVVLNKPPLVPVHATVDNAVENVIYQLQHHNPIQRDPYATTIMSGGAAILEEENQEESEPYFAPVQRLDINTSGLLIVATHAGFARYMAQQLRSKTSSWKDMTGTTRENDDTLEPFPLVEKTYRCLVCLGDSCDESVDEAWRRLSEWAKDNRDASMHPQYDSNIGDENDRINPHYHQKLVRHYLKVSEKAPKQFVEDIPEIDNDDDDNNQWLECLLQITNVSAPINLADDRGKDVNRTMASQLWPSPASSTIPPGTKAVAEVQIRLLTGRTHQIRGQLSALGFPIVGDEQYGGAVSCSGVTSTSTDENKEAEQTSAPQLLALQCSRLGFYEPDYEAVWNRRRRRDVIQGRPSQRWSEYSIDEAWWTSKISQT
jgi:23S rRNA-/tRNA-specific pseudouridylate synthase